MRITLPDELAAEVQALKPDHPLDDLVAFQLRRFLHIPAAERVIVVRQADRQALEESLQQGGLTDGPALAAAVQRAIDNSLGGIRLDFSHAQQQEIIRRARKNQVAPDVMLQEIAKEACKLMLDEA